MTELWRPNTKHINDAPFSLAPLPTHAQNEKKSGTQKESTQQGVPHHECLVLPIAKWIIIRSCYLLRMCIFKWSLFVYICVWCAFFPFWRSLSHCGQHSFIWRIIFRLLNDSRTHSAHMWYFIIWTSVELNVPRQSTTTATTFKPISHLRFCLFTCVHARFYHDDFGSVCVAFLIQLAMCADIFVCHWYCVTFDVSRSGGTFFCLSFKWTSGYNEQFFVVICFVNTYKSNLFSFFHSAKFCCLLTLNLDHAIGHCLICVHEFSFC